MMREFSELSAPDFWSDPQATFRTLFRNGERLLQAPGGGLCVFGYRELMELGRSAAVDGVVITDDTPEMAAGPRALFREALFARVGPDHRNLRKAALAGLGVDRINDRRDRIAAIVGRHLDTMADNNPFDLGRDLALPLTTLVWADLVGYPEAVLPDLASHVERLSTTDPSTTDGQSDEAAFGLIDLTRDVWRRSPTPFMRAIANAMPDGASTDPSRLVASMTIDGIDSAAAGLACTLSVLSANRNTWQPDDTGREKALQEGLRLGMPVILSMRQAVEPVTCAGHPVPAGTILWMWWGAGCMDPDAYEDPATFDPERSGPTAPVFGTGRHACLGHALFRVIAHAVVAAAYSSQRELDIDASSVVWEPGRFSRLPRARARFTTGRPDGCIRPDQ